MIILALPYSAHAGQVDRALGAYETRMRSMRAYEVVFTYQFNKGSQVKGDLILDHGKRMMYHARGPKNDYRLVIGPAGYREVDTASKMYDTYPYNGNTHVYGSRISPLLRTWPSWLMATTLKQLLPKTSPFSSMGHESVSGHACEHLHGSYKNMMANGTVDAYVGDDGLVYKMAREDHTQQGIVHQTWTIESYATGSFSAAMFDNPVPDGFLPFSLPYHRYPSEVGSRPSLAGWFDSRTGKRWSPPQGKPLLLLIGGSGSLPSDLAEREVKSWSSEIAQHGVVLAVGCDATTRSRAGGRLYDPDQKSLDQLSPPSTPMIFLFDRTGKLANLWMGFSSDEAASMRADVLKAIQFR